MKNRLIFLLLIYLFISSSLLHPHPAAAAPLPVYQFTGLDPSSLDSRDEDDDDEDDYDDEDDDRWGSRKKRRRWGDIGKIEIDLKRPQSVVYGSFSGSFLYVAAGLALVLASIVLGVYFGRRRFGFGRSSSSRNKRRHTRPPPPRQPRLRESIDKHYEILELEPSASEEEIRTRYRHLAKSLHSDKLANLELPEEVVKLTEEKFRTIQLAYDAICAERKMK